MWVAYMQEVLSLQLPSDKNNIVTATSHGSLLASADYHGAEVEVVRSGCADRVGLKGIVVRDTQFTFVIVNTKDEVKSGFLPQPRHKLESFILAFYLDRIADASLAIPKKDTNFRFEIPLPSGVDDGRVDLRDDDVDSLKPRNFVFELHGNHFEFRPADRAVRKFKWKPTDYL